MLRPLCKVFNGVSHRSTVFDKQHTSWHIDLLLDGLNRFTSPEMTAIGETRLQSHTINTSPLDLDLPCCTSESHSFPPHTFYTTTKPYIFHPPSHPYPSTPYHVAGTPTIGTLGGAPTLPKITNPKKQPSIGDFEIQLLNQHSYGTYAHQD